MKYGKPLSRSMLLAGLVLVATACGNGASESATATTSTTEVIIATTSSSLAPATTTTAALDVATSTTETPSATTTTVPATTTTTLPALPPPSPGSVLVANEDGVFVVTLDGVMSTVVDANPGVVGGIINYAIDDTQGGIIFELPGSPWTTWGNDSVVYRVSAGSNTPSTLLIPSPTQGLSLEDVEIRNGDVTVYYTRLETVDGAPDYTQTLRTYNLTSLVVAEIGVVGGWESGSSPISAGGGRTLRNWDGELWSGVTIDDHSGTPLVLAGNPEPDGVFDCSPGCVNAVISPDGSKVAWARQTSAGLEVTLASLQSGAVFLNVTLPAIIAGYVDRLDLNDDYIVVNTVEEGSDFPTAARIIEIASGGAVTHTVPIPGRATLLRSTIQTSGVVIWP